jgi:hypothetical protein
VHPPRKAGHGIDLQARAAADQEIAGRQVDVCPGESRRQELAEEDDGRLEDRGAYRARRGRDARIELRLRDLVGAAEAAREALDLGERAVKLQWIAAAGGAVEAVDVLREDPADEAAPLELGDREMAGVRLRVQE